MKNQREKKSFEANQLIKYDIKINKKNENKLFDCCLFEFCKSSSQIISIPFNFNKTHTSNFFVSFQVVMQFNSLINKNFLILFLNSSKFLAF